jgi:hypothetical protein
VIDIVVFVLELAVDMLVLLAGRLVVVNGSLEGEVLGVQSGYLSFEGF